MATNEATQNLSVSVNVASGVAAALPYRFANWDTTAGRVITHVPGANGAPSIGILAMEVDTASDGEKQSSIVIPNGGIAVVELGEAVSTVGAALRVGGNSSEVDGAAYLANASNDVIVGYALETGSVGDIIRFQYFGYHGLTA